MDLSKAYDCIPHDLLIAKLEAYGLDKISLNILFDYLNNRKQRTKIGCSFSSWYDIITGIPQGSILGPLLFNIFINDLFLLQIKSEICNFADDNTLYSCDKELGTVISNLKYDMTNILNWFRYNSMKANPDKFQFMILGPSDDKCFILKINAIEIRNTTKVELLGSTMAICKTRNGESENGMKEMMGRRGIRVRTRRNKVGMWGIGKGMLGMQGMRGIEVGMRRIRVDIRGTRVGMQGIRMRMRGIRVILCENLLIYCFG